MMSWAKYTAFLIAACALLYGRTAVAQATDAGAANGLSHNAVRGEIDTDLALKRVKLEGRWRIVRLDNRNAVMATFVIRNGNLFDIKDMEVVCAHLGSSGTQIDSNTNTIYTTIPGMSWRQIRDVKMGELEVPHQIARLSCQVTKLVPIRVDFAARVQETKEVEAEMKARATEAAEAAARRKEEEARKREEDEARRKEAEARFDCRITAAQFESLHTGMSYAMVERALDCPGRRIHWGVDKARQLKSVYQWKVEGSDADARATFQSTRLKSKQIDSSRP
jgi:hypothetical protein